MAPARLWAAAVRGLRAVAASAEAVGEVSAAAAAAALAAAGAVVSEAAAGEALAAAGAAASAEAAAADLADAADTEHLCRTAARRGPPYGSFMESAVFRRDGLGDLR